jgi:hypothetical protein
MGAQQSSQIEPMLSYCNKESMASRRCMNKYNYEREKFDCNKEFEQYKDCKRRWLEIRKMVMRGELQQSTPNPDNAGPESK